MVEREGEWCRSRGHDSFGAAPSLGEIKRRRLLPHTRDVGTPVHARDVAEQGTARMGGGVNYYCDDAANETFICLGGMLVVVVIIRHVHL